MLPHDDELKFFFLIFFRIQGITLSGADEETLENIHELQYIREYFYILVAYVIVTLDSRDSAVLIKQAW